MFALPLFAVFPRREASRRHGRTPSLAAVLAAAFFLAVPVRGEAPSDPLEDVDDVETEEVALRVWQLHSADQALRMGFASLAAAGYRELLEDLPRDAPERPRLQLSLVSALFSEGDFEGARTVLSEFRPRDHPGYLLRRAVLYWQSRRWGQVRQQLGRVKPGALEPAERGWYHFLQGLAADQAGRTAEADEAHERALKAAVSEEQRAFFLLGQYQTRLFAGEANEALASELKKQMEAFQGRTAGYRFAQQYAVVLGSLGKKQAAAQVIRSQIQRVPAAERAIRDQFLLLDGLIAGSESGQGRESLRELLETGGKRDLQRIALQKLAAGVEREREAFDRLLDRLIEQKHPLLEELHIFRAQLALREAVELQAGEKRDKRFQDATAHAQLILTRFPGSRLKREALEVLAASAWEQRQYRTSANHLMRLREDLPAGARRAEVALLIADCYFRAGEVNRAAEDYRNAADAYGTVLREHAASVPPGLLLYQRVVSEIRGGRLGEAVKHLRDPPADVSIGPVYRWQAEWNLVKAMQRRGQMAEAYERVTRLLAAEGDSLPAGDLRLRLEWLQAQLSFDAGKPEETLPLVDQVLSRVRGDRSPLEGELRERIIAYALLLQGQARLALGEDSEALASLEKVRKRLPGSEPALYSFLVEARHYTHVNRTVDAQQMLISLADSHKGSRYAPIALFEAAVNAQRRGQEAGYQDQAIALLERLVNEYPGHQLAFYARLRQGDILRQLNRFEAAEVVYLSIENKFPNHADARLVQLSLADCHLAQAARGNIQRFLSAISLLERLYDLPNIPADLRAEVGFKLAYANGRLARETRSPREQGASAQETRAQELEARAQEIYWATVSDLYLDEKVAAALGARGRYWVARCLFEYGQQFERDGRLENAREAYTLIKKNGLPGESLATANLARLMPASPSE